MHPSSSSSTTTSPTSSLFVSTLIVYDTFLDIFLVSTLPTLLQRPVATVHCLDNPFFVSSILSFFSLVNLSWPPLVVRQSLQGKADQTLLGISSPSHLLRSTSSYPFLLVAPPGLVHGRPQLFRPQPPRLALSPLPPTLPNLPPHKPTAHALITPATVSSSP